uniref:FkbH like protein n=1 Tax=Solibacter usitatus (strain Ellin6076) TaxID=234267 RepID=Q01TP0_SOLUE
MFTVEKTSELLRCLESPVDLPKILRKRKFLKEALLQRTPRLTCRVAVLGGSTSAQVKSALEVFLLNRAIKPEFYESEYGRFSEEVLFDNPELEAFQPQVVYIHTSYRNLRTLPSVGATLKDSNIAVEQELARFRAIWKKLGERFPSCTIIQNNFELPAQRPLGNLEAGCHSGRVTFVNRLNFGFAEAASNNSKLFINDIQSIAADLGSEKWFDANYWFSYKLAATPFACAAIGSSLANIIAALYGCTRKCLILDLDNTLWGGVVGDDGVANLKLGSETALSESYLDFQHYVKELKARGILLAVCSKNEESAALDGLRHPDGVLRPEDFAVIKANWSPKHENIAEIAATLNIGLDSLVFVDDNPAERDIVRQNLPQVLVPEVGADPSQFATILERSGCFEVVSVNDEDLQRTRYYEENNVREQLQAGFKDYGEFLASLQMEGEVKPFCPVYLDRITQLTNKTNQFNCTTRRYTRAEIDQIAEDPRYIHLYGRLKDRFGDHGLISVVVGEIEGDALHIVLWLMSCRVLKRGMEDAMMNVLERHCQARGLRKVVGVYAPTPKNTMVAGLYGQLGFKKISEEPSGATTWHYHLPAECSLRNHSIEVEVK